jgi:hypothetical protein
VARVVLSSVPFTTRLGCQAQDHLSCTRTAGRCDLKRYLAREIYHALVTRHPSSSSWPPQAGASGSTLNQRGAGLDHSEPSIADDDESFTHAQCGE